MGGLGSGGHNRRWRGTVEGCRRLSANTMERSGVFREGWSGRWGWTSDGGETTNWIWIAGGRDEVRLEFKFREAGGDWQPVRQTVLVTRIPKPYGGTQVYYLCPRCGRRVLHLYGAQARFLCRPCSGLVHSSSRERHSDRALRQARKIRRRLGAEPGFDYPAFRPKHMKRATYERLYEQLQTKEAESWDDALRLLRRWQKRETGPARPKSQASSQPRRSSKFW